MSGRRRLLVLTLAVAALASLGAAPAPQTGAGDEAAVLRITQVDTSEFPRVTVYVSATDQSGEPAGIEPGRIVLLENGQQLAVDRVRGLGESEPLSTLLVIDVSGSMNVSGKLAAAQDAARAYLAQMGAADQAGLIAFNTEVVELQPLTADRSALLAAVDRLEAADDTALYDAVAAAIRALESAGGRRAILVLSDGMDNSSQITPDEALTGIGPAGLSISTIGLGDPSRAAGEWAGLDVAALRQLAARAGGSYTQVDDGRALRQLYQRLGRQLHSEFVLSYISPSPLRDGLDRTLSVELGEAPQVAPVQAAYNPGGLVPEVPQPAPWPVFLGALALLAAMVMIPASAPGLWLRRRGGERAVSNRRPSRIRLKEPGEPRVRLH